MEEVRCPSCHSSNIATIERLDGYAWIAGFEGGEPVYAGETDIDWNSQQSVLTSIGELQLHCGNCGHDYVRLQEG